MRRKTEETFKRAYLGVRTKIREAEISEETCRMGSTSVMVINSEKLVIANMGDYRTVLCRDGIAYQKTGRHSQSAKRHWYRRLFSGIKHLDLFFIIRMVMTVHLGEGKEILNGKKICNHLNETVVQSSRTAALDSSFPCFLFSWDLCNTRGSSSPLIYDITRMDHLMLKFHVLLSV